MREEVGRLKVVMNVWMDAGGSVFVAGRRCGSHWVFMSVDLSSNGTVLYCDNLARNSPINLLACLFKFTAVFGIAKLERLVMMHIPTAASHSHQCTVVILCKHGQTYVEWSLQLYIFVISCAFIFYMEILGRILNFWFINGKVNTSLIDCCPIQMDHSQARTVSNFLVQKMVCTVPLLPGPSADYLY